MSPIDTSLSLSLSLSKAGRDAIDFASSSRRSAKDETIPRRDNFIKELSAGTRVLSLSLFGAAQPSHRRPLIIARAYRGTGERLNSPTKVIKKTPSPDARKLE